MSVLQKATIFRSIWRLYKALYGLQQAPRPQHSELCSKLRESGFTVSNVDPSLVVLQSVDGSVLALTYVNDRLITSAYYSAESSVRSPRKIYIFIIFLDQIIQKTLHLILKTEALLIAAKPLSQLQPILHSVSQFWEVEDLGERTDFLGITI